MTSYLTCDQRLQKHASFVDSDASQNLLIHLLSIRQLCLLLLLIIQRAYFISLLTDLLRQKSAAAAGFPLRLHPLPPLQVSGPVEPRPSFPNPAGRESRNGLCRPAHDCALQERYAGLDRAALQGRELVVGRILPPPTTRSCRGGYCRSIHGHAPYR